MHLVNSCDQIFFWISNTNSIILLCIRARVGAGQECPAYRAGERIYYRAGEKIYNR